MTAVSYSPEGDLLASGGDDATVRLWDPDTGAERAVLVRMAAGWAALLPDGSYKLEGDPDGSFWWAVKTCRFEPGELDPYDPRVRRLPAGAPILG